MARCHERGNLGFHFGRFLTKVRQRMLHACVKHQHLYWYVRYRHTLIDCTIHAWA